MVHCSLCSFVGLLFRIILNVMAKAMEYQVVVLLLSLLLAVVVIFNVHSAKLICDFNSVAGLRSSVASCPTENTICSLENTVDYGIERGPHTWNYTDQYQSPINILDKNIQQFPIREYLTWIHYDDLPDSITVENTGHTILVRANYSENTPTLTGADLLASYRFVQLCFRWSLTNSEGSEHMINYRKFPLELQAMHRTGPSGDCVSSYDLLMVAYFFQLSADNPYLDPLVQNLHRVKMPGTKIKIAPFPLSYLCHQFRSDFYSYGGSLTEPPCYQGCEWFVYPEPLAISERQLNEFRQILSSNGKTRIVRNARPVQNGNYARLVNFNQYNPVLANSAIELADNPDVQSEGE